MRPTNEAITERHRLLAEGLRRCSSCQEVKSIEDFGPHKKGPDGLLPKCRPCNAAYLRPYEQKPEAKAKKKAAQQRRRALNPITPEENRRWNLWKLYRMTLEEYEEKLSRQGNGCAICGATASQDGKSLPVDHDHETGYNRGILCMKCNRGLGLFCDNPDLLESAAKYLRSW